MKRKCCICGEKHEWDYRNLFNKPHKLVYIPMSINDNRTKLICRVCISRILERVQMETMQILYSLENKQNGKQR